VGIVDTYSGPPAVFGNDALNGFKLALEEINKAGVLGTTIEFTTRDEKFKPDVGLSMAKELVLQENVDLLVGTINSATALAISEYAKEQQIPFIVWISKSEKITGEKGHRYVFATGENTAMAGKAGASALARQPYTKYWIAGDDYEYGHAIADAALGNLKELKPEVEVAGESWWKVGEPDLIPYLTAIQAARPDAVIFATGGASMTNVLKAIHTTGMAKEIPIWIHTATDHAVLKPLGVEAPEGVMGTMDYHFYFPDTPTNQAFVKAFEDAYGNPPGFPAFHGYITAHFIAEAFKKAGAIDREQFIDALEGLKIDSPTGEIEMRACDHQAVLPIYMGVTKKEAGNEFLTATDIVTLSGEEVMPTCEEIAAARGG
jgi:branched-chain amino acid transport system substrate-binding protein